MCSERLIVNNVACFCPFPESIPDDHRPPRFPRELEDMTVTRGSKVQLECEVIGFPRPSIQWSVFCFACLSVCLPACMSAYMPLCLTICLSACLSMCLSVFLSSWSFVCISACLSVCLPVYLSICLSLHLSLLSV